MANISRPTFDLEIGGLAIDPNCVREISLQRFPLRYEGFQAIRGQIIIAVDQANFDPNPETNRQRLGEFKPVILDNIVQGGVTYTPYFGRRTRIKKARITQWANTGLHGESPVAETVLEVNLVDILDYYRQPEQAFNPERIFFGNGTPLVPDIIDDYLRPYGLSIATGLGDTHPIASTRIPIIFTGRGDATVNFMHRLVHCAIDNPYCPYYVCVDNDERIRVIEGNLNPSTSTFDWRNTALYYKPVAQPDQQLPGVLQGLASVNITRTLPSEETEVYGTPDGGTAINRTAYGNTRVDEAIIRDATGATTKEDRTVTSYDIYNRVVSVTKTSKRIDENSGDLVTAQRQDQTFEWVGGGVKRETKRVAIIESQLATSFPNAGLDSNSDSLKDFSYEVYNYTRGSGNSFRSYPIYQVLIPNVTAEEAFSASGARGRPPNPGSRDSRISSRVQRLLSSARIRYGPNETIINPNNLNVGSGTFTGIGNFTGFGTLVLGPSTITIDGGNQTWAPTGTLTTESGVLTGSGIYTGVVSPGRMQDIDFESFPASQDHLDRITEVEAQLIYGEAYSNDVQINFAAVGNIGWVPPSPTVDCIFQDGAITTGIMNDVITIGIDFALYGGRVRKLGTRDETTGILTLAASRDTQFITDQNGDNITDGSGNPFEAVL